MLIQKGFHRRQGDYGGQSAVYLTVKKNRLGIMHLGENSTTILELLGSSVSPSVCQCSAQCKYFEFSSQVL